MSSGEAEFYGAAKGAAAGLGMKALYRDIGYELPLRMWTDSSAAVGICSRQGLGKLRHLECTSLWIQQRIRLGELEVRKIKGEINPADLYTKHLESKAKIEQLTQLFGGEFREGRAAAAPQLRQTPANVGVVASMSKELTHLQKLPHLMSENEINTYDQCKRTKSMRQKQMISRIIYNVSISKKESATHLWLGNKKQLFVKIRCVHQAAMTR